MKILLEGRRRINRRAKRRAARLSENTQLFSNIATYYSLYFHSRNRVTVRLFFYDSSSVAHAARTPDGHSGRIFHRIRPLNTRAACCNGIPKSILRDYTIYNPLKVKKEKNNDYINLKRYSNLFKTIGRNVYRKVIQYYCLIIQLIINRTEKFETHTYTLPYTSFLECTNINTILNDK